MEIEKQAVINCMMNVPDAFVTEDPDGFWRILFVKDDDREFLRSMCGGGSTVFDSNEMMDVRKWTLERTEKGRLMLRAWDFPGDLMWEGYVWVNNLMGADESCLAAYFNDTLKILEALAQNNGKINP